MTTLFTVLHGVSFTTSVQASMMLFQVMDSQQTISDKYYVALYGRMLDLGLVSCSQNTIKRNCPHCSLPGAPFASWTIRGLASGFHRAAPSCGHKYVSVMMCMFSHWTEVFPCRQATASPVAKVLQERIVPTWGAPPEIQ